MSSSSSGKRGRSARRACWTIPSSTQAPVPRSSFVAGSPKRITARTPSRTQSSTSRSVSSTVRRPSGGSASLACDSGRDEEREDEGLELEAGLANELPQRGRSAEPPEARGRERAHANSLRIASRAAAA